MKNILAICGKELNSYFSSPLAYLIMAPFAIIFGFLFWSRVGALVNYSNQAMAMGRPFPIDVNEVIIGPLLMTTGFIALILIPMIAMRLFAKEKQSGTIELLLTSPIHDAEIVIGKWLAALCLFATLLLISLADVAFLFLYGKPDWQPLASGYLGLLLLAGALLAIGTFISTLTKSQGVAFILTFVVGLLLWMFDWPGGFETAWWAKAMAYTGLVPHFEPFSKGVIDSKDVVYFLSLIFLGLFLSVRSLESLRWRS